jgi:hypothetical protein
MGGHPRFFVCWVEVNAFTDHPNVHCSIHSLGQVLGINEYVSNAESMLSSSEEFRRAASTIAQETCEAAESLRRYPTSTFVRLSDDHVQRIGARVERVSFLGRECYEIVIEDVSGNEYLDSEQDDPESEEGSNGPDDLSDGRSQSSASDDDDKYNFNSIALLAGDIKATYNRF